MDTFKIIKSSEKFSPFIEEFWFVNMSDIGVGRQRIVPSPYILVSFNKKLSFSTISGLSKYYTEISYFNSLDFITIVFKPLGAFIFLEIPLKEFKNNHIQICDLENKNLIYLEDKIMNAKNEHECVYIIESFLEKKLNTYNNLYHNRLENVLRKMDEGENSISKISDDIYVCYKQFYRIFKEYIGFNPKEYIKTIRFQHLLFDFQTDENNLAELAFKHCFFDKSHLVKEFKEYSGYTPKQYINLKESYSKYHSIFRSTFIDVEK